MIALFILGALHTEGWRGHVTTNRHWTASDVEAWACTIGSDAMVEAARRDAVDGKTIAKLNVADPRPPEFGKQAYFNACVIDACMHVSSRLAPSQHGHTQCTHACLEHGTQCIQTTRAALTSARIASGTVDGGMLRQRRDYEPSMRHGNHADRTSGTMYYK